jgi:hypothetical protein
MDTKRVIASAFYQLKIGHGYNKAYLHRIDKVDSSNCSCGAKQKPEHLLLSCRQHQLGTSPQHQFWAHFHQNFWQHQLWTSPKHLFWGHFHRNFDRNHQKPPPRHSISIPGAPQALAVGCSPAEVALQRNFQLWCSQHRPHLILSDHHHLISPSPTPNPALPTQKASQLHQFEPFLLGFLVS